MGFKKGTMYVLGANIINLVISLFTGFILPKLLSIETYSNIKLFQLYITYIGVVSLGFADGMYLRLGGKNIDEANSKEILDEFKTFKIFQLIISIIAVVISILLKNEILLFCSLVILPVNIGGYLKNLYQATGKFDLYSKFMNINTLLIFIINIFLILIIKTDNYYAYIFGYIFVYFIYWIYIEIETQKNLVKYKAKFNVKYLKDNVKNGFFLMIGNFCNVIFTSIDRLFVQNILGTVKFAYYSFAVSIENLMNVFVTPISTVMYNYLCNNQSQEQVLKLKRIIMTFSVFIVTMVFPAKFLIEIWITKYAESIKVLFLLFAAQYISIIIRTIHTNLFKAKKQQNKYFMVMIAIVILSIILNIISCINLKTMESFAIATLITNIVWFIIGEIMLREYILKIKDYIYFFIEGVLFLICGNVLNSIYGILVYIAFSILTTILFEKSTFIYLKNEGITILQRFIKKKGE